MPIENTSDKQTIIQALDERVTEFIQFIGKLDEKGFNFAPPGKWTAGQHLDHLIRSIKPLNLAYGLPPFILRWKFGSANRPSKTYQGLVEKYKSKLGGGGKAKGQFIPSEIDFPKKQELMDLYAEQKKKLCKKIAGFKEKTLDTHILPHPLLGKLTLREMLFFTIYHNEHHLGLLRNEEYKLNR